MILNAPLHLRRPCSPAYRHLKPSVSLPTIAPLLPGLLARRACACAPSPLRHVASPAEGRAAMRRRTWDPRRRRRWRPPSAGLRTRRPCGSGACGLGRREREGRMARTVD
ncbi:unnamed protein product [Urochloa humidicola]